MIAPTAIEPAWLKLDNIKGPDGDDAGGGVTDIMGVTTLVVGQAFVDVFFPSPMSGQSWSFVECRIINTDDPAPTNILLGLVTQKSASGFRQQLSVAPTTTKYFLQWVVRPPEAIAGEGAGAPEPTANLFTGPHSGAVNAPASFLVRLIAGQVLDAPLTIVPHDEAALGEFNPTSVVLTNEAPSAVIAYTPRTYGKRLISVTNDGGLMDIQPIMFNATADRYFAQIDDGDGLIHDPATVTVWLPTDAPAPDGLIVQPHAADGTFSPDKVVLTSDIRSASFIYTPNSTGAKTITLTNNSGLIDPDPLAYAVHGVPATAYLLGGPTNGYVGVDSTPFIVEIPTGFSIQTPVTITPNDGGNGGTFTPATVSLSDLTHPVTFLYTPANLGSITIATTNDGGLTDPAPLTYNASSSLLNGLLHWWRLDERNGTRYDAHGTYNLTDHNSVGSMVGVRGGAALFNGGNWLQGANEQFPAYGDFTIAFWAKFNSDTGIIISKDGGPYGREWDVQFNFGMQIYLFCPTGAYMGTPSFYGAPTPFYFFIVEYDSTVGQITFTLNLIPAWTLQSPVFGPSLLPLTMCPIMFGARGMMDYFFQGGICQCGWWPRKLTSAEKIWLYNNNDGRTYSDLTGVLVKTFDDGAAGTWSPSGNWDGAESTDVGQYFTSFGGILDSVQMFGNKYAGNPTGPVTARLLAASDFSLLAESDPIDAAAFPNAGQWMNFNFSSANRINLASGTNYFISFHYAGGDAANKLTYYYGDLGHYGSTSVKNAGGGWTNYPTLDTSFLLYVMR